MISAFGVDHTISKSFRKLAPKLERARMRFKDYDKQNMDERVKLNYVMARQDVGVGGRGARKNPTKVAVENAKELARGPENIKTSGWKPKQVTRAMVDASGKRGRRKRVLP